MYYISDSCVKQAQFLCIRIKEAIHHFQIARVLFAKEWINLYINGSSISRSFSFRSLSLKLTKIFSERGNPYFTPYIVRLLHTYVTYTYTHIYILTDFGKKLPVYIRQHDNTILSWCSFFFKWTICRRKCMLCTLLYIFHFLYTNIALYIYLLLGKLYKSLAFIVIKKIGDFMLSHNYYMRGKLFIIFANFLC